MKKTLLLISSALLFSGCMTMSGTYQVSAQNSAGEPLTNQKLIAEGSGIYTVRNALCSTHKNAIIIIKDSKTGKELSSESPYKC